jgi:RNA polymerase sigma-70 factor (ECF subfamily)
MAYRMLGSLSEADDAVQETWLRLDRSGGDIDNLGGWLTTVTGRVCLDMLRARRSRREEPLDEREEPLEGREPPPRGGDPEEEALLADSVGVALLVVLDTLTPAERLAFVLHDLFAVPFDEIASIMGRSTAAAKMLASRGRRRVRRGPDVAGAGLARRREVVEAFLAASREGDFEALLALLDPGVVVRADAAAVPAGAPRLLRGAREVARQALTFSRRARHARVTLVNGSVAIVVTVRGRVAITMAFTFAGDRIAGIEVLADPGQM